MTVVFGSSTTTFSNYGSGAPGAIDQFHHKINHLVLWFVYLFVARFVLGYIGTLCVCIAAARTTKALRKHFLEKLLRQEIAHFDIKGGGAVAGQVTTSKCTPRIDLILLADCANRWQPDQHGHG
jgi:ATP-binding cassette, subfamily B (MDR/TAP), member 1